MKLIHESFAEADKPEWLTFEQILQYERRMCSDLSNAAQNTFIFDSKHLMQDIKNQLNTASNAYGEPEAWINLPNGRSIEIVQENISLGNIKPFYSISLNCSSVEYDSNLFDVTNGIIKRLATERLDFNELHDLLDEIISYDKESSLIDEEEIEL